MEEERLKEGFKLFSIEEQAVFLDGLQNGGILTTDFIRALALAKRRAAQRADSDRRTDAKRRELVGAHVPKPLAERVRACAKRKGVSMYRLLVDWIEHMCDNEEGLTVEGRDKTDS